MSRVYLQEMVDDIRFDGLPPNWQAFDLETFSRTKRLWDYQRKALENAIKALWKYYKDFHNFQPGESPDVNDVRKRNFFQWYRNNGLDEDLDISLHRTDYRLARGIDMRIKIDQSVLAGFCRRHNIRKLAFFGSVLRDDFGPDSDVDVLVEFDPDHIPTLFDIAGMEQELSDLLGGRKVDLRTPEDLSRYFRQRVLEQAEVQYAAE